MGYLPLISLYLKKKKSCYTLNWNVSLFCGVSGHVDVGTTTSSSYSSPCPSSRSLPPTSPSTQTSHNPFLYFTYSLCVQNHDFSPLSHGRLSLSPSSFPPSAPPQGRLWSCHPDLPRSPKLKRFFYFRHRISSWWK